MKTSYPVWAISGFALLSLLGVILRLMFVYPLSFVNYNFLLHSHSHFAFSGWIFLSLVLIISRNFKNAIYGGKLNLILIFTLISAFGMLISFLIQGYKAISISFSTLFILTNYYFAFKVLRSKAADIAVNSPANHLLKASLVFLCVSSLGPFALGPIMATGLKSSPLYFNAIYFYLHFQMNGWMLPAALAVYLKSNNLTEYKNRSQRSWMKIFIWSTIPLFFIFTLWNTSSLLIRLVALAGALLNMISWCKLIYSFRKVQFKVPLLAKMALTAISIKVLFQLFVCYPPLGHWVFSNRNLVIGYVHLLTLGAVTPLIINAFSSHKFLTGSGLINIHKVFIVTVITYVSLLFLQPLLSAFSIQIPGFQCILLIISIVFLLTAIAYLSRSKRTGL